MPQYLPGDTTGDKRRKRKNVVGPPPPTPQPALPVNLAVATGGGGEDYYDKLSAAEDGSAGTLPTALVKAIVGTQPRTDDVWRTSSLLAQHWDISPQFFLGDKGDYTFGQMTDPLTGQPLTFGQARNFLKVYEPMYLYQLLKQYQAPVETIPGTQGPTRHTYDVTLPGRGRIDGERIAAAFRALAPVDGDALPFTQALAIAISHAEDKDFDEERFKANLKVTLRSQALFPNAQMSVLQAVSLAEELTKRGITATSPKEIAYALDPNLAAGGGTLDVVNASLESEFPGILARAKANPDSEDAIFVRQQQAMALTTMGFSPEVGAIFTGMLDAIKDRETNYITAGEEIAQKYQMQKDSAANFMSTWVGRNLVGKPFNLFMDVYDRTVGVVERVGLDPGVWGMDPTGRPLWVPGDWGLGETHRLAGITGAPEKAQAAAWQNAMQDVHDIIYNDADYYAQLEKAGMPPLAVMVADLIIGFKIGPDILALKAYTKATRWGRLVGQGLTEERVTGYVDRFAPELLKALQSETDAEKFYLRVVNSQVGYYTRGLDPQLMAGVYHIGKNLLSAGVKSDEVLVRLKSMLTYGAGWMARDTFSTVIRGTEEALNARRAERAAELAGAWGFTPEERMVAAAGQLPDEARWALGALDDMDMARLDTLPGGLMPELPHTSWVRSLGMWDSGRFRDSGLGRAINAATAATSSHTNYFRLNLEHPNLIEDAGNLLVRSRVFSEQERADRILQLSRLQDPRLVGRETMFAQWVTDTNESIISRLAGAYGLDADQVRTVEEALSRSGVARGRIPTYGIMSGYAVDPVTGGKLLEAPMNIPVREPYLTSQLLNYGTIVDPVALRSGMAEATGYYRQVKALVQRSIGMDVGAGALHARTLKKFLDGVWVALVDDLFLSVWKPLAVMRPAYILRVVGIEEQFRYFSTLGGAERLAASRIGGVIADRLPGRSLSVIVERGGKTEAELADLFGYTRRNSFLATGEASAEFRVPARVTILDDLYAQVDLPLPSPGQLTRRGYAESASRQFQLTGAERSGLLEQGALSLTAPREGAHFEPIARESANFYPEWERYLKFQIKQDPIGNLHLQAISQGMDEEASIAWVADKLMTHEYQDFAARLLGKKKFSREALEEQVRVGQNAIRNAGVDAQVATDTLSGLVTQGYLRALPHPPEQISGAVSETYLGRQGPFHRARDRWGDLILRMPTNALSRHPYAASWETRMREGMLNIAAERGPLTESAVNRINASAEKFARTQVQRIMFDYTRTTRFAEATAFAFPFFQPYAEAFMVWGRIIRQNPTVIGYVGHLMNAGSKSGVFEKDYAGITRVPMTNWLANGLLLDVLFQAPGFHTSAPLNAFNLFWQSAINVPLPGFGDVPIPVPALNPEALFVMQRYLYSDETFLGLPGAERTIPPAVRSRLLAWATEFGNVTPAAIIPAYLRNFLAAAVPEWFSDQTQLQADNMLRLMEYKGITPEKLVNDDELARQTTGQTFASIKEANAWMANHAENQGRILSLWRGLMGMFSPAALTVGFPYQDWQEELSTLREQYPDDYRKVEETFLSRHPDGWQFLIGNTVWNPQNSSPIPIPANTAVTRFFMGAGAKDFSNKYPEFAFWIIPHEIRDDYDFGSLWAQVGAGWRTIQSPQAKLEAEAVDKGWSTYFDHREVFNAWTENHSDADTTAVEIARNQMLDGPVAELRAANPIWAAAYDSWTNKAGIDPYVWGHVTALVDDPMFLQTDLGKALKAFIPLYEDVKSQMERHNISNLYSSEGVATHSAEIFGLDKQWEEGLKRVEAIGGEDWTRAYDLFFDNALHNVVTQWDRFTAGLSRADVNRITDDFDQMQTLDDKIDNTTDRFEKFGYYQQKRELVNQYYTEYGSSRKNPMVLDWMSKDPYEKLDYRNYIATLPYAWLTQFDRRVVLGDKTNAGAEKTWEWYNDRKNEISFKEAHDPAFGSGDAYDKLDKQMAAKAKGNPTLAAQIEHANKWAYAFFQVNPSLLDPDSPGSEKWQKLYDFVDGIRSVVDHYNATNSSEIHGTSDLNPENKVWWNQVSEVTQAWVNDDLKENAFFKEQWKYYADLMGDEQTLFEVFFPQSYYRIG